MKTPRKSPEKKGPTIRQPQLLLIQDESPRSHRWTLDEQTRESGRKGLAKARAALEATRPAHDDVAA